MRLLVTSAIGALVLPLLVVVLPSSGNAASCPGLEESAGSVSSTTACDSAFVALRPKRLYDSRKKDHKRLRADRPRDITVTGRGGVPTSGAVAVTLNVTAVDPSKSTYLTVWPTGTERPVASTLHLRKNATRAALVVSGIGSDGKVSVVNASGRTDVIVDVSGYHVLPASSGTRYHPARPFRLFDSRDDHRGALAQGESRRLKMPELGGVLPKRMRAAMVNVTAVGADGPGYLTLHRAKSSRPTASTLNFSNRHAVSNRAVSKLRKGAMKVTNRGAATHVVVDVVGWYSSKKTAGGHLYSPLRPTRVLDTRTGIGAPAAQVGDNQMIALDVAGGGRTLPPGASVAVMSLTSTRSSSSTYVKTWASGTALPVTRDVNVRAQRTTSNLVAVPIGSDGRVDLLNRHGSTDLVADVVGYYRPAPEPPTTSDNTGLRFGMSAPADQWDQRVSEVGSGLKARRIFLTGFGASLSMAQEAMADGMYPVMSFKTGGPSWADVAAGRADGQLNALAARLDALPGRVFVAVHHEPEKDGTPQDWSAMQEHALPILGAPDNVEVGVIGNGWWWSALANGKTDAEIAQWVTPGVLRVSDVIASDTYHGGEEDAGVKIRRMSAWAGRVGVGRLGIGEFNGATGTAITNAVHALRADPRFTWACVFNSDRALGEVLTGERLAAFRAGL